MTRTLIEVGFYGKLPCRGDFLQRRVPQDFVDSWDAWLQECLHTSREQLQEAWLDTYLTGPVWRFAFTAGVCGGNACAGILVPSVDRVGRYFPLTVVAQLAPDQSPLHIACASAGWFEAAEALVLDALEAAALDFDTFDEQIALLRDRLDVEGASESTQLLGLLLRSGFPAHVESGVGAQVAARWHVPLGPQASLQSAISALAARELTRYLQPLALWWTQGSNAVAPSWLATGGLPGAQAFVPMLSGKWAGSEWTSLPAGGYS